MREITFEILKGKQMKQAKPQAQNTRLKLRKYVKIKAQINVMKFEMRALSSSTKFFGICGNNMHLPEPKIALHIL